MDELMRIGGMIDSGTTSGIAGYEMRLLHWDNDGVDNEQLSVRGFTGQSEGGFRLGTFAMASRDANGENIILIFPQYDWS